MPKNTANKYGAVEDRQPRQQEKEVGSAIDLGRVYLEIRASLVRYTTRYFKRTQEAEDVVQEAFVKVIEAQRKRQIDSPKSYLFRTARNISLKRINTNVYRLTDEVGDLLTEPERLISKTMEEQFEVRENFELYCRAVRSLPIKCRRAYVLCRVYGFTQQEVADRMGVGLKAVEGHLARATKRCLEYIETEQTNNSLTRCKQEKQHG